MLRMASKRVKDVVDNMRLPAVVRHTNACLPFRWTRWPACSCLSRMIYVPPQVFLRQLTLLTARCRITTLELPGCISYFPGLTARQIHTRLARVLALCPALVHLDLSGNQIGPDGTESLAEVLPQCTALAHLNLRGNRIALKLDQLLR